MATSKKIMTLMLIAVFGLAFTGCSDDQATVLAPVVDTAPPAVPANLTMVYQDNAATVSWSANTVDRDLAGFVVVRERYGVSEPMFQAPLLVTSFVDDSPLSGSSMYHVYSVDLSGNQSAVATVYLTVALNRPSRGLSN